MISNFFRPGDTIQAGEEEYSALPRRLSEKLSPTGSKTDWDIDPECLGVWYRPNFDNPVVNTILSHDQFIFLYYLVSVCSCSCDPSKRKNHFILGQIAS